MTYQEILYDVEDPVAVVTLNRPAALNAFTVRMLAELRHAIARAEADSQVVGIVLTGAGRGFGAGMDMNALSDMSKGDAQAQDLSALQASPGDAALGPNFSTAYSFMLSVRKPIIAAIHGPCAGLAFAIALLCDLRFVTPAARFTTAFAQRGLIAEHGTSWLLPRLVGTGVALDLLWSGRKIDGQEAHALRLAERLIDDGSATDAARDYVRQLAATSSPASMRLMKAQVYRHLNMPLGESLIESNSWMDESLKQEDFKEGVASFMERRPPAFARIKADDS